MTKEKRVTKMDMAREIFNGLEVDDKGKRDRKAFITSAQESGLTESGAKTYYQMLRMEAEGKDPYAFHNHRKESGTTVKTRAAKKKSVSKRASKVKSSTAGAWTVIKKDSGKVVATASSRNKARAEMKELGGAGAGYSVAKA